MKHVVSFSGGKDSTALLLWARENLPEFETIFLDTGWEHPITYAYVQEINETILGGKLRVLKSEKYTGFADLVLQKGTFPSRRMRFCTEQLKLLPLFAYYQTIDNEITAYVGIRAEESEKRAQMKREQWVDDAGGYWLKYPLFDWTAQQCFDLMKKHGVEPNPLYKLGMKRVGCWPCIMVSKSELWQAFLRFPELRDQLTELETRLAIQHKGENFHGFFSGGYIPDRFCSETVITKDGRSVKVPTAADVYDYLMWEDPQQLALFDVPTPKCFSVYNLCE